MEFEDYSQMCRLCLKLKDQEAVDIFNSPNKYNEEIVEMFEIRLLETPGWPSGACAECTFVLNEMKRLKASILDSHMILFNSLQKQDQDPFGEDKEMKDSFDDSCEEEEEPEIDLSDIKPGTSLLKVSYQKKAKERKPPKVKKGEIESEEDTDDDEEEDDDEESEAEDDEDCLSESSCEADDTRATMRLTRTARIAVKKIKERRRLRRQNAKEEEEHLEGVMKTMDLLKCHACNRPQNSLNDLFEHFRQFHKNPKGYIFCCDRKKFGRRIAYDHIRVHLNDDAFTCKDCGNGYASTWSLELHRKQAHSLTDLKKQTDFMCELCGKTFDDQIEFNRHVKNHNTAENHKYQCPHCERGYMGVQALKLHISNIHERDRGFKCEECGRGFDKAEDLSSHHYKLHRSGRESLVKGVKRIPCEKCNVRISERNYQAHVANNCFKNTTLVCIFCNSTYRTSKYLLQHMRNRHSERVTKNCPHCSYEPADHQDRMKHIRDHHFEEFEKLKYTIKEDH